MCIGTYQKPRNRFEVRSNASHPAFCFQTDIVPIVNVLNVTSEDLKIVMQTYITVVAFKETHHVLCESHDVYGMYVNCPFDVDVVTVSVKKHIFVEL